MLSFFQNIWVALLLVWLIGFGILAYKTKEKRLLIFPAIAIFFCFLGAFFDTLDANSLLHGSEWYQYKEAECRYMHPQQNSCLERLTKKTQYIKDNTFVNQQIQINLLSTFLSFFRAWVGWINYIFVNLLFFCVVVIFLFNILLKFLIQKKATATTL